MKFRKIVGIASLSLLGLSTVAISGPVSKAAIRSEAEHQSVKGRISSVSDGQFAIDTVTDEKANTVQFMIDNNTKVDGKLTVGAQAAVDYRVDGNTMIATHVVVMPASGVTE